MKKLILIVGDTSFQYDTPEEVYHEILGKKGEDYRDLSPEEKAIRRRRKAFINVKGNESKIALLSETSPDEFEKSGDSKIFIDSDETYLLSLLNMNIVTLLEEKSSNHFTSGIDKSNLDGNYVLVNHFANSLLKQQCKKRTDPNKDNILEME